MRIATFNINGIKARVDALSSWLQNAKPDVVCLQEIKSADEAFPREHFENMGYHVETHGQKSFNGVAILSRFALDDVIRGLPSYEPSDEFDTQARWIEASVISTHPIRICCLYLPNGNPAPGAKYDYKLNWMHRLEQRVKELLFLEEPFLCAGDYNIIPTPIDAAKPDAWVGDALYMPQGRAAYRRILNLGLYDAFRADHPQAGHYSFWDYQAGAWQQNNGIRIDHILLSSQSADRLKDAGIDKEIRAEVRPSDHVPVWVELED